MFLQGTNRVRGGSSAFDVVKWQCTIQTIVWRLISRPSHLAVAQHPHPAAGAAAGGTDAAAVRRRARHARREAEAARSGCSLLLPDLRVVSIPQAWSGEMVNIPR